MKCPSLLGLLFLAAQTNAQILELQTLEGNWYLNDRTQLVVSEWRKTGENEMRNRVFTLYCGDTTEISRATLTFENQSVALKITTDSLGFSSPEKFKLERVSETGGFVFANENPNAPHSKMTWEISGGNFFSLTVLKNGPAGKTVVGDFRRYFERVTRLDLKLRAGINATSISTAGSLRGRQNFSPGFGAEASVLATFRSLEGPLQIGLEIGLSQRQTHVFSEVYGSGGRLTRDGIYHRTDWFAAVVPEIFLDPERQWSVLAGAYMTAPIRTNFTGEARFFGETPPGNPDKVLGHGDIRNDWGLLVGFNRQLDLAKHPKLKPTISVRANIGNNNVDNLYGGEGSLRVRSFSVGAIFRLRTF